MVFFLMNLFFFISFNIIIFVSIYIIEILTKEKFHLSNKKDYDVTEFPNSKVCKVYPLANTYPIDLAFRKNIKMKEKQYPSYKKFRAGTKYEYTTVQFDFEGQEFILNPFTDAIRKPNGQLHEYLVRFNNKMTVFEYKTQRLVHEMAVLDGCKEFPSIKDMEDKNGEIIENNSSCFTSS